MTAGVQYHEELNPETVIQAGFSWLEVTYEQMNKIRQGGKRFPISGMTVKLIDILQNGFEAVLDLSTELMLSYLVIDIRGFGETALLDEAVEKAASLLGESMISIYLENGYLEKDRQYRCCDCSEITYLKKTVIRYNELCGRECFGLCLNVGYANLLAKNLITFVAEAGSLLKMIHMNDNDGFHDDHQMPLTFTSGRGGRTTDIFRFIGTLARNGYRGWMIFDTSGLWETAPERLQSSYLRLLYALVNEWEEQLLLESRLNRPGRQLILFGTGIMLYNYVCEWGWKYPPAFLVDNNSSIWGEERYGIQVKSPETILEIPADQRNVCICNRFYEQVGDQLRQMGVDYWCYNDNYYM